MLTADRTNMTEIIGSVLFAGFAACLGRQRIPLALRPIYEKIFFKPVPAKDGRALLANYPLRKIEAALRQEFSREDVAVVRPQDLKCAIGPDTKAVGISAIDPLGIGPVTSAAIGLWGGEAWNAWHFRKLLFHPAIRAHRPRIIVGGPGTWQFERFPDKMAEFGIDCVVIGEAEDIAPEIFRRAVNGQRLERIVKVSSPARRIPPILGASLIGLVEITRGCGRGCTFCSPTMRCFSSTPLERILHEVKVNVDGGQSSICLHGEDFLQYRRKENFTPNSAALIKLFKAVTQIPGVSRLGVTHGTLAAAATSPALLRELADIIFEISDCRWIGVQVGLETGSAELMRRHMAGKALPGNPGNWPEIALSGWEAYNSAGWVPAATLILGLPGETEDDIIATIELVEKLRTYRGVVTPLFFVPLGALHNARSFIRNTLTERHKELLICCSKQIYAQKPLIREYIAKQHPAFKLFVNIGLEVLYWLGTKRMERVLQPVRGVCQG